MLTETTSYGSPWIDSRQHKNLFPTLGKKDEKLKIDSDVKMEETIILLSI